MQKKCLETKAERLRNNLDEATANDRVKFKQKLISIMQAEIKQAELTIQTLTNDKESLKSALSTVVNKKETFYKLILEYKAALEKSNTKILKLKSSLDHAEVVHSDIAKLKNQLAKRDEKIKNLQKQNKKLENLLVQHDNEESTWKKIYKNSQNSHFDELSDFDLDADIMLQRIKRNSHFLRVFKNFFPCVNYFRDLIEKGKMEEALNKTCKFVAEIIKDFEMGKSGVENGGVSGKAELSYVSDEEFLTTNDDERIERLNLELKNAVAKSKAMLSNRDYPNKSPNKNPILDPKNKSLSQRLNQSQKIEATEKSSEPNSQTPKNSFRTIPKIKIHRKSPKNN